MKWKHCCFSPDGRRLAINGRLIIDVMNRKTERELDTSDGDVATFSPDSQKLLVVKAGAKAELFDVDTGKKLQSWKVKEGEWTAFAFGPKGSIVASGGADKMIHLWDTISGKELARWDAHDGEVTALLFSRDGKTLYSGGQDGTLKLWSVPFLRQQLKALKLDW